MKIYFATTNKGKLEEAREILGVEVIGTPLDIDEIQSLNPIEVATKKAQAYFDVLKKPLFVEDVSLAFEALGKLPGTYINDFWQVLGNGGLMALLDGKVKRSAVAQTTIVYIDAEAKEHVFIGVINGEISKSPRGSNGFGWDPIFIPSGSKKTYAEMSNEEKNKHSMREKALKKMGKWLNENG